MLRASFLSSFFVALTALAGCSGGIESASSDPSQSGSPSSSSPGTGQESEASTRPLDLTDATSVSVSTGVCGGVPGQCSGRASFEIFLETSTFAKHDCVPGEVDPETKERKRSTTQTTKRVLDASEMERVRDALAQVRVSSAPFAMNQDGQMSGMTVKYPSGTKLYSPEPACNHSAFEKIVGFEALWETVRGL